MRTLGDRLNLRVRYGYAVPGSIGPGNTYLGLVGVVEPEVHLPGCGLRTVVESIRYLTAIGLIAGNDPDGRSETPRIVVGAFQIEYRPVPGSGFVPEKDAVPSIAGEAVCDVKVYPPVQIEVSGRDGISVARDRASK